MAPVLSHEWKAGDLTGNPSWRPDFQTLGRDSLGVAKDLLDNGPGFAIVTGVPILEATIDAQVNQVINFLKVFGNPLPQGPEGDTKLGWLVRNEGVSRFGPDGSYVPQIYTSKSADFLDIHNDGAMRPYGLDVDLFALFCLSPAEVGGESTLVSSLSVFSMLQKEYPRELERLCKAFPFERSHVTPSGQEPIIWAPVFEWVKGRLRVHCNRQRIEMAWATIPEQFGAVERAALEALDDILGRDELQLRCQLGQGDLLIVDDHLVLHGRDSFVDTPDRAKRCLIRILLQRGGSIGAGGY
jgi:hypothetical protein